MSGLGNPLSFELGGSPSPQEAVYDAMFQSVGNGIQSTPTSIVEAWRMSRARGLAACSMDDRAAMQAFPNLSTDFLTVYEDILRIVPNADITVEARRTLVAARYTRSIDASFPKLTKQLKDIDPLFSILILPPEYTRTTEPCVRAFEDWDPADPLACGPAFDIVNGEAGPKQTAYPNYSDDFIAFVLLNVGPGALNPTNKLSLITAQDELNESLPAWVDFRTFTSCGFILDQDFLDVTAFCDGLIFP